MLNNVRKFREIGMRVTLITVKDFGYVLTLKNATVISDENQEHTLSVHF